MDNQEQANKTDNTPTSILTTDIGQTSSASVKESDTAPILPCDDNRYGCDVQRVGSIETTHRKSRISLDVAHRDAPDPVNKKVGVDESSSTTQEDEDEAHQRGTNTKSSGRIEGLAACEFGAVRKAEVDAKQSDIWQQGHQGVALKKHEVAAKVDLLDLQDVSIERVLEYADVDLLRLGQWQWQIASGCQVNEVDSASEGDVDGYVDMAGKNEANKAREDYLASLNDPLMLLSFPASVGMSTMMHLFPAKQVWQQALARGEPIAMLTTSVGIGMIQRYPECLSQIPPELFGVAYTSGRDLGGTPLFYLTLPEAHWVLHCWGHLLPYVHPESLNRQVQRGPYAEQTVINNLCVTETGIAWLSEHHDWIKMVQPATWQHVIKAAPYHGRSPLSCLESSLLGQKLIDAHGLHKKIRDEEAQPLASTLSVTEDLKACVPWGENNKNNEECVHEGKQVSDWPGFFYIGMVRQAFKRLQEYRHVIQGVLDACKSNRSAVLQLFCQGGYATSQIPAAYRLVLRGRLNSSLFEVLSRSRFGQSILMQNQWVIDLMPRTVWGGSTLSLDTSFVHNWLKGDHAIDFFKRCLNRWNDLPMEKWRKVINQGEYEGLSIVFWALQPKMHQWLPWIGGLSQRIRSRVLQALGRKGVYTGQSALGALCMTADGMKWLRNYAHDMIPKIRPEALMMPVCLGPRGMVTVSQCLESHVLGQVFLKRWYEHWQSHPGVQQRHLTNTNHANSSEKTKQSDIRASESVKQEQALPDCLDTRDNGAALTPKGPQHLVDEKIGLELNAHWDEVLSTLTMCNTKRGVRKRQNDKIGLEMEITSTLSDLSDLTMK